MGEIFYRQLGQQIRTYRKFAGLTLEQLAEKANLDGHFLGYIERAQAKPSLDSLHRIALALDVEVGRFFHFAKTEQREVKELVKQLNRLMKKRKPEELRQLSTVLLHILQLLPPLKRT